MEAGRAATASRSPSPTGRHGHALLTTGSNARNSGHYDVAAARAALERSTSNITAAATATAATTAGGASEVPEAQHGGIAVDKEAVIAAHKAVLVAVSRLLVGHPSVLRYFCALRCAPVQALSSPSLIPISFLPHPYLIPILRAKRRRDLLTWFSRA